MARGPIYGRFMGCTVNGLFTVGNVDRDTVDTRSIVGRHSVDTQSTVDRCAVDTRSILGRQSVDIAVDSRSIVGR